MESCVGLQLQFDPSHAGAAHGVEPVQVSLADVDAVVSADAAATSDAGGIAIQEGVGVMVQAGSQEDNNNALDNLFQAIVNSAGASEQLEMESIARSLMHDPIQFT